MKRFTVGLACLAFTAMSCVDAVAGTVTFGSGTNQFNMEFVKIGNPGNAADTTGKPNPAGAVGYEYAIGKFSPAVNLAAEDHLTTEHTEYTEA